MKMEHNFGAEHGFTGSAGKNMRPTIPGYKHGHEVEEGGHIKHAHGAKEHYGKKGHVDHDGDHSYGSVHYDEHGFQHHKKGGKVEREIEHAVHEHENHEHGGKHTKLHLKHGGKAHKR